MLKVNARNNDLTIIDVIDAMSNINIKSKLFYPGFNTWFNSVFKEGLVNQTRDIISVRDKRYDTLLGFCLIKHGHESKICNLSPLIDGVGMTQTLLDVSLFYFTNDYTIDVPVRSETEKLHRKLNTLGFEKLTINLSQDNVPQITYIRPKNIGWV